jgi:hypothetical protein
MRLQAAPNSRQVSKGGGRNLFGHGLLQQTALLQLAKDGVFTGFGDAELHKDHRHGSAMIGSTARHGTDRVSRHAQTKTPQLESRGVVDIASRPVSEGCI